MNLQEVHNRQSQLMNQYHAIEMKVCLGVKHPTRILHDYETQNVHCQEHIRLIAWRGFEELREAGRENVGTPEFKEELIDALHFFAELNLFCGFDYISLAPLFRNPMLVTGWKAYLHIRAHHTFKHNMGIVLAQYADATYELKSKPWKQTPKVTDWNKFQLELAKAFESFLWMLSQYMTHDEAMDIYFKKANVNQNRQETNY